MQHREPNPRHNDDQVRGIPLHGGCDEIVMIFVNNM